MVVPTVLGNYGVQDQDYPVMWGTHASKAEAWYPPLSLTHLLIAVFCEVVRPVPVVICCVRTGRAINAGMESDEGTGSLRKCAQCDPGDQVERATADRPVGVAGVENDVTVL